MIPCLDPEDSETELAKTSFRKKNQEIEERMMSLMTPYLDGKYFEVLKRIARFGDLQLNYLCLKEGDRSLVVRYWLDNIYCSWFRMRQSAVSWITSSSLLSIGRVSVFCR